MSPKKDNEEGITWTIENTVMFCDVLINYIRKNGRTQLIKWKDLEDLFMKRFGKRVPFKSLKNKYESMKKDWCLWKHLKMGVTCLGWNPTTGRLDCSNDWWERKIKEKPESKKFQNKGVFPELEEKWDHLSGDILIMIRHNGNTKKDDIGTTIPQVMDIMNRTIEKGDVRVGEEFWCHALLMFRDPSNRKIFFNILSDDGRLSWSKFAHSKNIV